MGIVYQVKPTGGALVVSEHGALAHSNSLREWWVPPDRYVVRAKTDEGCVLTDRLANTRNAIIAGTFNYDAHPKTTVPKAHQKIVGASSPCVKKACTCSGGKCTKRCGCYRGEVGSNSGCSCNGTCAVNPRNDCNAGS